MSKMGQYVQWCMEEGYTDEYGDVDSMDHVDEYMKYKEKFKNPQQEEYDDEMSSMQQTT